MANLFENLFGFEFKRKENSPEEQKQIKSFVPKEEEDGAVVVAAGGSYGTYVDLDGSVRTEAELVTKYREMSLQPECDAAIDEIVNESISIDEDKIVDINLDNVQLSENVKKVIRDEFQHCLKLIEFNKYAYDIYRRWYIDGRLYYHVVVDESDPKSGIKELRYIDPRKIRKVREISKKKIQAGQNTTDISISKTVNEYFIFNDKGFYIGNKPSNMASSMSGIKVAKDSILHVVSGLTDNAGTMVLSYLHKSIKALNQLRTLEDALVIYRLARAPERRIWYIDTGNLPKMKAEQYVRDIMVKHKNRLVYDASTGEIRDDRKFMCFSLDTKIPLLDGRTLTLQELIDEYKDGKQNWVYSCDPTTGKFIPGPVSWAGITKKNSEVVKVTFDNGKSIICTPDHKFPVWNKGFVEAKDLVGESIIPGYRRMKQISSNGSEYEQIYKNDTKTWEFTHREVSRWKDSVGLSEEFVFENEDEPKSVIHHIDINRFNNSPANLVLMGAKDHYKYHSKVSQARWNGPDNKLSREQLSVSQKINYTNQIIKLVELTAKLLLSTADAIKFINLNLDLDAWNKFNENKIIKQRQIKSFTYKDLIRVCEICGHDSFKSFRKEFGTKETKRFISRKNNAKKGSDEWKLKLSEVKIGKISSIKSWKIKTPDGEEKIIENLSAFCRDNNLNRSNIKGKFGSKKYFAEELRNHKAISVEYLDEKIDVGCITIDLEETYHSHHTYLLDAGVYTKNTMLEDYWLPRKEGGRGTEVTTLPGGQTLGQMDDVLYFQKRFLQTLNVPVSRLNSDALFSLGRATEITRDELKFNRFIVRLRQRFSHLFIQMLEKQLILKGITTADDWTLIGPNIQFEYAKDNYFSELKDNEILEGRSNLARNLQDMTGKYYSHEWIRKNVLKQSDDDIEENDQQIAEENNSGDIRWINPVIEQNAQFVQQQQAAEQQSSMPETEPGVEQSVSPGLDSGEGGDSEVFDKIEQIRQAQIIINQMKKKNKENRSPGDQSKYKAAVQIVAKNKAFLQKLGMNPPKATMQGPEEG